MSITHTIRHEVITDLERIQTKNGFDTEVVKVYDTLVDVSKMRVPSLMLLPDEGGSSDNYTHCHNISTQTFEVLAVTKGSTDPHEVLDLLDDVRNAVEPKTSNIQTLKFGKAQRIHDAVVTAWSAPHTSGDIRLSRWQVRLTIEVTYDYERGSA